MTATCRGANSGTVEIGERPLLMSRGPPDDRAPVPRRCLPEDCDRAGRGGPRRQGGARPHDLLSARRRPAGRHRIPGPRERRRASRSPTRARARRPGTVAHVLAAGRAAARSRRDGRPRARLGAALRAHAPAHRAARDVLRRHRAGHGRQHRAGQGAARLRHRHHAARRGRASSSENERADRARRRDRDRLDHRRGARRPPGARQDHERAAAARRRARAAAAGFPTSTCSPAAARTSRNIAEIGGIRCCASATKASATSVWRSR